jgi:carboxypeptidase C (cathepsin A)
MDKSIPVQPQMSGDQPLVDNIQYGPGPDDSISNNDLNLTENRAVTHKSITLKGTAISYTASAGHLVTYDQDSARPSARIFYVSFTADDPVAASRPVTFFYNGGPGSSSVFLLLGSFGPRRIKTRMPEFTPPPYALEDNTDSLLDRTDLVFINPVGTGYSAAIFPAKNKDFWGVDQDAGSIKQFIKRYLTVYGHWNSPKFLFGESYGTPRTCVLTWLLHEDGVDLNGIVLQSSILDFSQRYSDDPNSVGILPTFAADALFHKKNQMPQPQSLSDLPSFMKKVEEFAREKFEKAKNNYPKVEQTTVQFLSEILGIPPDVLMNWKLNLNSSDNLGTLDYLTSLLQDKGLALGVYDGRVTANDTGIAGSVDPKSGSNDPTLTAVGGVYTAMWNVYLNEELKYTSTSPFVPLNLQANSNWDYKHVDPTGRQKGGEVTNLYTAGDLAASMELNPYLKVFCANGYYDAVTPFFQTRLDLENMQLGNKENRRRVEENLVFRNYPSGHMIYLDDDSRCEMKKHLGEFYDEILRDHAAAFNAEIEGRSDGQISMSRYHSPYRRRFSKTRY